VHGRIVQITQANKVVQGRKMRVDTTVLESNIHYAPDSSLLDDGVRVLMRSVRTEQTGASGAKLQDRSRTVKWRVLEIPEPHAARPRRAGRG
jgi:IS5 family transposase